MKKNRWVVEDGCGYATWDVTFPNTRMINVQELWQYVKSLLVAAEETEIMRIVETSKFDEMDQKYYFSAKESDESYVDFVDRISREEGVYLFWQLSRVKALSKICYYDLSGKVVEEEISYPAIALNETRPELMESETQPKKAIELYIHVGYACELDNEAPSSSEFIANNKKYNASGLLIHVYSDVWFPLVLGGYHDWPAKEQDHLIDWEEKIVEHAGRKWFDNSELALRHTPRLNDFIRQAKQLTLEYGGTWEIDVGTLHSMWNEDGIVLDIEQILQWVRSPRNEGN